MSPALPGPSGFSTRPQARCLPGFCCDLESEGKYFQGSYTHTGDRNLPAYWPGGQVKFLNILYLQSLSSISNSSLYFRGPVKCAAHSRCSILHAKILLLVPQLHFWAFPGLDFYLYALCLTSFLAETVLGAASTGKKHMKQVMLRCHRLITAPVYPPRQHLSVQGPQASSREPHTAAFSAFHVAFTLF